MTGGLPRFEDAEPGTNRFAWIVAAASAYRATLALRVDAREQRLLARRAAQRALNDVDTEEDRARENRRQAAARAREAKAARNKPPE